MRWRSGFDRRVALAVVAIVSSACVSGGDPDAAVPSEPAATSEPPAPAETSAPAAAAPSGHATIDGVTYTMAAALWINAMPGAQGPDSCLDLCASVTITSAASGEADAIRADHLVVEGDAWRWAPRDLERQAHEEPGSVSFSARGGPPEAEPGAADVRLRLTVRGERTELMLEDVTIEIVH